MTFGPYEATVTRNVDGDSAYVRIDLASVLVRGEIDLGFGVKVPRPVLPITLECRVFGINAPEVRTAEGKAARDFAAALLPVGAVVEIVSHGWDKYGGRFDGDIVLPDGRDFATAMVAAGHAVKKDFG